MLRSGRSESMCRSESMRCRAGGLNPMSRSESMSCGSRRSESHVHTTHNTPVPVRSPKSNWVGPHQCCVEESRGNPRCCSVFAFFPFWRLGAQACVHPVPGPLIIILRGHVWRVCLGVGLRVRAGRAARALGRVPGAPGRARDRGRRQRAACRAVPGAGALRPITLQLAQPPAC